MTPREEARQQLHIYQARTGLSLREIADRVGYSPRSIAQFSSDQRYGDGSGEFTAQALMSFFRTNPAPAPSLPGKLCETECSHAIDKMLAFIRLGGWGTLYGPSGTQKSFVLEYRAAECARDAEPVAIYIECSPRLTPTALLRRIGAALGAPYAQYKEGILQSVLFTLRRRARPVAIAIDEAQHLDRAIDTLETVRDLGGKSKGKAGILISGNEGVFDIFRPRPGIYFEQWRGRLEQKKVRLPGLSREDAIKMLRSELGELRAATVETLLGDPVKDPVTKEDYFSAHRIHNSIESLRAKRAVQ